MDDFGLGKLTPTERIVAECLKDEVGEVYRNGWPDFLAERSDGTFFGVEVKGQGMRFSEDQKKMISALRKLGLSVYKIDIPRHYLKRENKEVAFRTIGGIIRDIVRKDHKKLFDEVRVSTLDDEITDRKLVLNSLSYFLKKAARTLEFLLNQFLSFSELIDDHIDKCNKFTDSRVSDIAKNRNSLIKRSLNGK